MDIIYPQGYTPSNNLMMYNNGALKDNPSKIFTGKEKTNAYVKVSTIIKNLKEELKAPICINYLNQHGLEMSDLLTCCSASVLYNALRQDTLFYID